MQYKLVPMDGTHLPQIEAIERVCFQQPWSVEMMSEELHNDNISLIVAEGEEGMVLGYGAVRAVLDEGCLDKIAVRPGYRRQGIAEAILSAFLRFGQSYLSFVTLEVRAGNASAISLYKKLGFHEVGLRKEYYREPKEDAVLMTVEFPRSDEGAE